MSLRILFVVRPSSVHSARWVNQVADEGWDIHVFPADEGSWHPDFRNVIAYSLARRPGERSNPRIRTRVLWPLPFAAERLRLLAGHFPARWSSRAAWLANVVRRLKPDIVHALEFQKAGYLTVRAKALDEGRFPPWVVSNWGSDISLYGPLAGHTKQVRGVLASCDYYTCECHRDVRLAREYGFRGELLPVLPGAGGFDLAKLRPYRQPGPTSSRRLVALKGYQHWAGRALVGLRAIELCARVIKDGGYRVAVYSAEMDVRIAAEHVALRTGIEIEIIPPLAHEEMLRLHGRSRVSVGLSISEGLSTSALEALLMGAFPVQSDTSCLTEMLQDGAGILMVPPEDPVSVAAAIGRALTDDALVDRADELNMKMASERLEYAVVQAQVIQMYETIAARTRNKA